MYNTILTVFDKMVYGECATCHHTNCRQAYLLKCLILMYLFYPFSTIKIVSQKMLILPNLSQNWSVGFSNGQFYDGRQRPSLRTARSLVHSLSLSLSLFACFPFFPLAHKNNASVHFRLLSF
jgi:hypothetical protein